MRTRYKKVVITAVLSVTMLCMITGCKPSKKKVLSSTYYKELQKEKEKLEKENKKLKKEAKAKDEPTVDEERAADYLDKIARDRLVKLEVGYADNMDGSEFVEDSAAFSLATAIARRADMTQKYTPEEVQEKYGPGYEYILYDEDNAIYEINVYGGNYVVFTDLPNNVYYVYNASALGEAYLHYKNGYPDSNLLHRLADAPLITDEEGNFYENTTASEAANAIDRMDKKFSSKKAAQRFWKKKKANKNNNDGENNSYEPESSVYTFYHHGNELSLTIYDKYFSIKNMDGNKTWYKADKKEVKALKDIFKAAAAETEAELKDDKKKRTTTQNLPSHSSEIQEESEMSQEE